MRPTRWTVLLAAAGLMALPLHGLRAQVAGTVPALRGPEDDTPVRRRVTTPAPDAGDPAGQDDGAPTLRPSLGLASPPIRLTKPVQVTRIALPRPVPPSTILGTEADPAGSLLTGPDLTTRQGAVASPTIEAVPTAGRRPAPPPDDPYGPLGYRVGSMILRPSIEVDTGYDSNPNRAAGRVKGAAFTSVLPHLDFASDWSRNSLSGTIDAGYAHFYGQPNNDRPTVAALVDGRYDLTGTTALDGGLRLVLDTQRIGVDTPDGSDVRRPLELNAGATLGASHLFGPLAVGLHGTLDRHQYENSGTLGPSQDGSTTVLASASDSYNTYGGVLRAAYDTGALLQPFAEVRVDRRIHDDRISSDGFERDSDGLAGRGGLVLATGGPLNGQASLGYGARAYDDARLHDLDGLLADASLVWDASALTRVTFTATTDFDETSDVDANGTNASGIVARTVGLQVSHALRRNLIASASVSGQFADYDGIRRHETTFDAGLGLEYRLTRSISVRGSYGFERFASTVPGTDYTANTVYVGLKLQH